MNIIKEWVIPLIVLSYLLGITTGLLIAGIIVKVLGAQFQENRMTLYIDLENVTNFRDNDNFGCQLIRLIFKADRQNIEKLKKDFPMRSKWQNNIKIQERQLTYPMTNFELSGRA